MREVNFSFPHANKASVGITTTLYDRRALDCTSTLPLINSLLHLAYLTTSSARIRSILTVDGGVERLVCILKNGRSKNVMDTWKWNLAFQCVFNIGVRGSDANKGSDTRGSENIRTRVVEADVVPVIATILDNYMQVREKMLARQDDPDMRHKSSHSRKEKRLPKSGEVRGRDSDLLRGDRRRQAPPPIEILPSGVQPASQMAAAAGPSSAPRAVVLSSPPERTVFSDGASLSAGFENTQRSRHGSGPIPDVDLQGPSPGWAQSAILAPTTQHRTTWSTTTSDLHSVPPMTAGLLAEPPSELDLLPVTPTAPSRQEIHLLNPQESVEQDLTVPTDSDDGEHVDLSRNDTVVQGRRPDIMVNIQDEMDMDQDGGRAALIDDGRQTEARLEGADINMTDADAFNSMNEANATPRNVQLSLTPTMPQSGTTPPLTQPTIPGMFSQLATAERASATSILNTIPKEEDVIMSLHLLAYLSKYCNLRPYFQQSHLVPKLKIGREIQALDGNGPIDVEEEEVDNEFEYCQPDDYNMFPLVEKYTLKHHSQDVRYWACVVMRNLCRKDKSRGDIRQCAYYKCGKWEDYARQFAKCRRCRQTKYCSKECQKSAWVYHRHWCDPINSKDCHESKDGVEAKHDQLGGERATPES